MRTNFDMKEDKCVVVKRNPEVKNFRPNKGKSRMVAVDDFVAVDIETTGLSPLYDEIIELGAVRYRSGEMVDRFTALVKPEAPVDDFITEMTGISNEMLTDAPSIDQILPSFLAFVGADIIVGHNVNFDINFLYDACERLALPAFDNDFIDTMRLARRMYRQWEHHTLDDLLKYFGLAHRTLHRSLDDCELTAVCYLKMSRDDRFVETTKESPKRISAEGIVAVEGMENIDSPLYGKECVFTGTLESFTRKEAAQIVVNIGGTFSDRVTRKTNYLILGNNDYCKAIKGGKSNKQKTAEKLITEGADMAIIPEQVFLDMLQMGRDNEVSFRDEEVKVEDIKVDVDAMERDAYESVASDLKELLIAENLSADYLLFKQGKSENAQYSSVYLFNEGNLFFRISFRGKQNYFMVPTKYKGLFPEGTECGNSKANAGYCRIAVTVPEELANYAEILKRILEDQLDAYPTDFGCCSRYEACSDAMKCIHPDSDMALRCAYRKNIKKGRVFYGKRIDT